MTKALIFDMDGTIVDNIPDHHEAWLKFLEKYNIIIHSEDFAAQNHGTADEMIIRFFGNDLSTQRVKELGYEKELIYRDLYKSEIKEITGFTEFVQYAKNQDLKIALATMGNADNINFVLKSLKIKNYFHVIVGGNEIKVGKPHPEIYNTILEKLKVEPEECLAFEDSLGGVQSASRAGIQVVGILTSHTSEEFKLWKVITTIKDFTISYESLI